MGIDKWYATQNQWSIGFHSCPSPTSGWILEVGFALLGTCDSELIWICDAFRLSVAKLITEGKQNRLRGHSRHRYVITIQHKYYSMRVCLTGLINHFHARKRYRRNQLIFHKVDPYFGTDTFQNFCFLGQSSYEYPRGFRLFYIRVNDSQGPRIGKTMFPTNFPLKICKQFAAF